MGSRKQDDTVVGCCQKPYFSRSFTENTLQIDSFFPLQFALRHKVEMPCGSNTGEGRLALSQFQEISRGASKLSQLPRATVAVTGITAELVRLL